MEFGSASILYSTGPLEGEKVSKNGEKTIGLVDVTPDGKFESYGKVQMSFNVQLPCTMYGLSRLVVVSSAGSELSQLVGKDGDDTMPQELYVPAWRKEDIKAWLKERYPSMSGDLQLCGEAVPRLIVAVEAKQFQTLLEKFINNICGKQNAAEKQQNVKDAHTMVLLRGSQELSEETVADAVQKGGEKMGFVSQCVENAVMTAMNLDNSKSIEDVIRMAPKTAPRIFEKLVKKHIMSAGLKLAREPHPEGWAAALPLLQATQSGEFPISTFVENVLYSGKGDDQKSVDWVIATGKVFYLMQVATGASHRRICSRHLRSMQFHVPLSCESVMYLYIVPTSTASLHLTGDAEIVFKGKKVEHVKASARAVLDKLAEDVQLYFEPHNH
eukprot:6476836-Amphidinium_carterae.1